MWRLVCLSLGVLGGHLALLGWLQPAPFRDVALEPPLRFQLASTAPLVRPTSLELSPGASASPLQPIVNKVKTASLEAAQTPTERARPAEPDTLVPAPVANPATGLGGADKTIETGLARVAPAVPAATVGLALTAPIALVAPTAAVLPSASADYLDNPAPSYPAVSRRLGEQGKVVIRVLIGKDGVPQQGNIGQSSGYARLDQAALRAAMGWRYVPGQSNGLAQDMWFNVPIHFALQ